jgi:hypothetical protein
MWSATPVALTAIVAIWATVNFLPDTLESATAKDPELIVVTARQFAPPVSAAVVSAGTPAQTAIFWACELIMSKAASNTTSATDFAMVTSYTELMLR